LCILLLKIGYAATDSMSILKVIDAGVPKESILIINSTILVVKMILPLIIAKKTSGTKPMNVFLTATPIR